MTREELAARLAEIQARMKAIDEEHRDAVLPDEVETEFSALDAEFKEKRAKVDAIDARVASLRDSATVPEAVERGTDPGAPTFIPTRTNAEVYGAGVLDSVRMSSNGDDDYKRKLNDAAMRAVEKAKLTQLRSLQENRGIKQNAEDSQARMAEMLDSIDDPELLAKRMLLTGGDAYERAFGSTLRHGTMDFCSVEERQALIRAQALGTDSAGGFAVPFQLDPTVILTNAGTQNPIRQLARVEQITGKQWQGVTSAGTTANRGAEGSVVADGSFTLTQPVISTNRVQGFVPFNIEIELSWGALRREITSLLMDAKDREEDSFITGDGVTGQQPGGLLGSFNAAGGVYVTAGGVASFSAADVYALNASLPVRWENNASWLGHKAIYHKLRQFDTAGGAQLWARVGDGQPPRLLDYPDRRVSAMSSALTTGNSILAHGDFRAGFLIVDRIGMTVELVPHLFDTATGRPTGQRGVYAVWMNNSKILVPQAYQVLKTG